MGREGCWPQAQPGEGAKCGYQEIKEPMKDAFDLMLVSGAIRAGRGPLPSPVFLLYSGHLEVVEEEGGVPWKKSLCCWLWGIKCALRHERHHPSCRKTPFMLIELISFVFFSFYVHVHVHV